MSLPSYAKLLFILIIINDSKCDLFSNEIEDDMIIKCAMNILNKYPEPYTLITTNIKNIDINTKFPILHYSENKLTTTYNFGRFSSFVFIIKNTDNLEDVLNYLYKSIYWNSRAKYLFAYYGTTDGIDNIFRLSWKYWIFNVNVIADNGKETGIYTFFPYKEKRCGEYVNYEQITSCETNNLTNIFPRKIPFDLHGCDVKLMAYVMPPYVININGPREKPASAGVEVTILHAISKKMNFTEMYINNPYLHWGYKYEDGSFTLMLKAVHDRVTDIMYGYAYANQSYIYDFDPSFCHLADKSVWFFPTALQMAQWKNLTAIFEGRLWLIIFIMIFLNGVAWWIIGRKREKSDEFNEVSLCLMQSLYVMLQGSVIPPKRGNVRLTFSLWSISCLLIFTAHQCQLISILTSPLYDKQMTTLEDLVRSKLEFGFFPTLKESYSDDDDWVHKTIFNNFKACPLTPECVNRTAFKRDFAVIKNIRQVRYFMPRYYTFNTGRPMLYETQENAFPTKLRYLAFKGFPLLERLNSLLLLLQSNGLVNKWDEDSQYKILKLQSENIHQALSLDHLQGAFYVWIFGICISLVVFILEYTSHCLKLFQFKNYFI